MEVEWRRPALLDDGAALPARTFASRWTDSKTQTREAIARTGSDYHTISLALQPTVLALETEGRRCHDGAVRFGMVQVSGPSVRVRGIFRAPCDFLHLRIANSFLAECHEEAQQHPWSGSLPMVDSGFERDPAIEQLTRALLAVQTTAGDLVSLYAAGVATALVTRLMTIGFGIPRSSSRAKVSALPKWRLARTVDYVEAHLGERITLLDMAAAAGLTRMHFAAQFRTATGLRPHEFLLRRRVDRAQALLAETQTPLVEVALGVGFQTQAHFSTVFRRLVGETPWRWRQFNRRATSTPTQFAA
jgi:AraC family transcriptional regulator